MVKLGRPMYRKVMSVFIANSLTFLYTNMVSCVTIKGLCNRFYLGWVVAVLNNDTK